METERETHRGGNKLETDQHVRKETLHRGKDLSSNADLLVDVRVVFAEHRPPLAVPNEHMLSTHTLEHARRGGTSEGPRRLDVTVLRTDLDIAALDDVGHGGDKGVGDKNSDLARASGPVAVNRPADVRCRTIREGNGRRRRGQTWAGEFLASATTLVASSLASEMVLGFIFQLPACPRRQRGKAQWQTSAR